MHGSKNKISKIGFSEIGGIFVGKDISSGFGEHYAVTVIVSFGQAFRLALPCAGMKEYSSVIIQKNSPFSIESPEGVYLAFIHVLPFSDAGQKLFDPVNTVMEPSPGELTGSLEKIEDWFASAENKAGTVAKIIDSLPRVSPENTPVPVDRRILKALEMIMDRGDENPPVENIASEVNLSVSHFNRLFKKETGLTYRRFVMHSKLIKSIQAISLDNNLTTASFMGGFADQPHFTRTFRENFGIKPSRTLK